MCIVVSNNVDVTISHSFMFCFVIPMYYLIPYTCVISTIENRTQSEQVPNKKYNINEWFIPTSPTSLFVGKCISLKIVLKYSLLADITKIYIIHGFI